jgi:hypothetical protein
MMHGTRRCFACGAEQAGPLPFPAPMHEGVCLRVDCQHRMHLRLRDHLAALARTRLTTIEAEVGTGDPIVLLPSNRRPTRPLSARRRAAFAAHLDATFTAAVDASGAITPTEHALKPMRELAPHESQLLGQACATCRGACCQTGGTTAWLTADSIRRALVASGETPVALQARYLRELPPRHYRDSCVYHTHRGCALSPVLRSDTCHAFLCNEVEAMVSLVRASSPAAVRLVATEGSRSVGVTVAQARPDSAAGRANG